MANFMKRFWKYCTKHYEVGQLLDSVRDERVNPQHKLSDILAKICGGIIIGMGSLNQLEEAIRDGDFDFLGSPQHMSADTMTRGLLAANLDDLTTANDIVFRRSRRNKSLRATKVEGYTVMAVDGTGAFATHSERLGKYAHRKRNAHGEETAEDLYYENVLAISYVGGNGPKPIIALKRIPPGCGETTVGRTEIEDLFKRHCRYCDIFTLDANFAKAPILNEIMRQNKDFVVRVKQDNYDIIKDADGLFNERQPDQKHNDIQLKDNSRVYFDLEIWEDEDFTSWKTLDKPVRCLKVRETRRTVNAVGETVQKQTITTHFVTSCPMSTVPALTIWKIAHQRWDIENTGFHFLKHHFVFEHAYGYHPHVIQAMYLLFQLMYNLFQLFVRRNLSRCFDPRRYTLQGVIRRLYKGLVMATENLIPDLCCEAET